MANAVMGLGTELDIHQLWGGSMDVSFVYEDFGLDGILTGRYRYSTMDNIDGKQARRTGTSSPLGELFEWV